MRKLFFLLAMIVVTITPAAGEALYLSNSVGDSLWNTAVEPVDSRETVEAMMEWVSKTHGVTRIYWRGLGNLKDFKIGTYSPITKDWRRWCDGRADAGLDRIAVQAAKKNGMEIFFRLGLLEFGLQPDATAAYQYESTHRIEHPEWCGIDRWGERRQTGGISFAYPDARKFLVNYFVKQAKRDGFDGLTFYTYVENMGIRYEHEFGFEPPVVKMFNAKYPEVDLKRAKLTPEQAEYWYYCRGHFLTLFMRELSSEMKKAGKKISIILDPKSPQYVSVWEGAPLRGTGNIHVNYRTWIKEGLVDEFIVGGWETSAQGKLLDELLVLTAGTKVKLVVLAYNHLTNTALKPYFAKGVVPLTNMHSGPTAVKGYSKAPVGANARNAIDWKVRTQTLREVATGKLKIPVELLKLTRDPSVLVRRNLNLALAKVANGDVVVIKAIEAALKDEAHSVRVSAATALKTAHRPETAAVLLQAASVNGDFFQVKNEIIDAFFEIGASAAPVLLAGLSESAPSAREVSLRALCKMVYKKKYGDGDTVYTAAVQRLNASDELPAIRLWIVSELVSIRLQLSTEKQHALIDKWCTLIESDKDPVIRVMAADTIRHCIPFFTAQEMRRTVAALKGLFAEFGDNSKRNDAAYGWRYVGNSLSNCGESGRQVLINFMNQRSDKFLAYISYQVLYEVQDRLRGARTKGFNLVDEDQAIADHDKYAPPFPGWRKW